MNPKYPSSVSLAHLPTPIERLDRLSSYLRGPDIYIKRDDQTGLGGGGNKIRKLEYLLAQAQSQGCDHVITTGGVQSNHCRQTAAAAARLGLGCSLVLRGEKPPAVNGNLLLDHLFGAHVYWAEDNPTAEVIERIEGQLRTMGHIPYLIPVGGSNVVGTTAYVAAMRELMRQLDEQRINIDVIVVASGSGGTQAGLVLGGHVYGFRGQVFGVSISRPADDLKMQVAALSTATATHLGLGTLSVADRVEVNDDYAAPGYAVMTDTEQEAIELLAQKEGILLDPVYTGRAMGALIDLTRWGAFTRTQSILFWHTGGAPALFAYADGLSSAYY